MTSKPITMQFFDDTGLVVAAVVDNAVLTVDIDPDGALRCLKDPAYMGSRLQDFVVHVVSMAIQREAARAARAIEQKVVES